MGKRYTEQEKQRIQELANQGHTDESIAQQLGRSANAIRNLRHRNNIKARQTQTISQLKQEKQKLNKQNRILKQKLGLLEARSIYLPFKVVSEIIHGHWTRNQDNRLLPLTPHILLFPFSAPAGWMTKNHPFRKQ